MANDVVTLTQRFSSWWAVGRGITQRYLPPKAPVKAALGQHWDPFKNLFDECFAGWFALYFKWLNQLETPDLYKAARACANVCLCQADILRFPPKNKTELSSNKIKDPGDSSLKRGLPGPLVVAEPPGPGRFEYHSLAGSRAYQIPASLVVNTRLPPFCTWAKKKWWWNAWNFERKNSGRFHVSNGDMFSKFWRFLERFPPFLRGLDFDQPQNDEGVTQKMGKKLFWCPGFGIDLV